MENNDHIESDPDKSGFSNCQEPVEQWKYFYHSAWQEIRDTYINKKDLNNWASWEHKFDSNLCNLNDLDLSLKYMTESLGNKWTKYQSRAEMEKASEQVQAGIVSSGMELRPSARGQELEFMHFGSAAQASKLRERDKIISINGQQLSGLSEQEAEEHARAKSGGRLAIQFEHEGRSEEIELVLEANPKRAQVETKELADGIAYIRLPDFNGSLRAEEFASKIKDLVMPKDGEKASGLVLDLRNNPGGDFPLALTIASMFLKTDSLITQQLLRKNDGTQEAFKVNEQRVDKDENIRANRKPVDTELLQHLREIPVAILINGSTVSAAELLASALKDNERAEIIGKTSFGKGEGYREQQMPSGGKLKVAQMKYLSPNGLEINGKGVSPDLDIELARDAKVDNQLEAARAFLIKQTKTPRH